MYNCFTLKRTRFLLSALFVFAFMSARATYTPVVVTGFTADVIANGIGASSASTTADVDGVDYAFVAPDFQPTATDPFPTYALPASGTVNSATTSGLSFQLGSYSGNNSLRIDAQNGSGTLTLATPQSAGELYVLLTSGSGSCTVDVTVTFTDATTQVFTGINVDDWYDGANYAIKGVGRVNVTNDALDGSSGNPRLYQQQLELDPGNYTKLVASISFTKTTTSGVLNVMGVTANDICNGMPTAGTLVVPSTVCSGVDFVLAVTGNTNSVGMTYQWQSSPSGTGTWTDITGATTSIYTLSGGQTAPTDYRLQLTCNNGGAMVTTSEATIVITPANQCYCVPSVSSSGYEIEDVTTTGGNGTDINNVGSGFSNNGYGDFTSSDTVAVIPGATFNFSAAGGPGSGYTFGWRIWIDWNQNGTLDDLGEQVFATSSYTNSISGTITVPVTAVSGATRMRIGANYYNSGGPSDPCSPISYGEFEDYIVDVAALAPCTGAPVAGTATGPSGICDGRDFTLNLTGFSYGLGISYQWESSPAGQGLWNPIANATDPNYTVSGGQSVATDYHMLITCANGGGQDVSNVVTVNMNAFYQCYCAPDDGSTTLSSYPGDNYIETVEIPTTTLSSSTSSAGPGGYTLMDASIPANTATLSPGLTYTLNIGQLYTYDEAAAWIDYDQSGTYDAGEFIAVNNGTATFTVPVSAPAGPTGLRVRVNDSWWGAVYAGGDACWDDGYGETEDYTVTIPALAPCTGTPDPTTASGPAGVCSGLDFTLSATGMSIGLGITYEWQSFDGTNWNPITGGTSPTFVVTGGQTAATDYRLVTTCANGGGQDISNTVSVAMNLFYDCYCSPLNGTTLSQNAYGTNYITSVEIPATTLNAASSAPGPDAYSLMDPTVSGNTGSLAAGASYTINVGMYYGSDIAGAWIDYDQSGTFDAGEEISFTGASGTFTVPATATQGMTGLRVRVNDWSISYSGSDACTDDGYGETEDYVITITPPPTCAQPTTLSTSNITATSADIAWVEAGSATQWSVEYGPQGFTPGTGTFVSVTGTPATTLSLTPATVYTFFVRAICSATDSSAQSLPGTITTPCIPATGPYSQTFDNSSTPLCWTNSGPETWQFTDFYGPDYGVYGSSDHSGNGGYYAWVDGSGSSSTQNITLTSVPVDVTGFAAPNLSYYMKSYNTDDGTLNKLIVEAFDGTNWIQIDSVQMNMPSSGWYNRQVLLAPFSLPATVQIRFIVDKDNTFGSAYNNDILLDDVNIVDGPLAVGLGDINAVNVHSRNRIDWNTINETTGDYFILERSADGRNFSELATVNAKGQPSTYSYWDEQPVSGVNYYRLKMMDAAGKAEYSKVVTATVKGANGFTVEAFPNPVTDVVTVKMYGTMGDHATVSISDITGKVIKMFTVSSNELKVNMGGMAQGIYLIRYADDNHAETLKVNKQ